MNEPGMEGVGSLLAGNEKQVVCPPPPPPALCRCPLPFVHSSHRAMKNRPAGDSCGTGPRYLPLICVQILLYSESILDSPSRHLMGCRILLDPTLHAIHLPSTYHYTKSGFAPRTRSQAKSSKHTMRTPAPARPPALT